MIDVIYMAAGIAVFFVIAIAIAFKQERDRKPRR